ncbi:MAG: peptide chain release factor N(5)-glutamine methyltransferase [Acidiferrobacter sp.]
MTTIRGFLAQATRPAPGSPDRCPIQEVWTLGCHILQRPLAQLLASDAAEPLRPEDAARWRELMLRRQNGEPLAYLVGHTEFWSLPLKITPDVLVPRPETEILVERALSRTLARGDRCIDAGTGSGAIALALKKESPDAFVAACDRSPKALAVARANAHTLGLEVAFWAGSWLDAIEAHSCTLIAANPPYIESADPCLDGDGLRYEPRDALDGGTDGLTAFAALIPGAVRALRPGGRLLVEHGYAQGPQLRMLLKQADFGDVATHNDYAGHPRVTEGIWHG